jgi:hypothetical protein
MLSIFRPMLEPGEPSRYQMAGMDITCPHCKNQEFHENRVQYNAYEPAYAGNETIVRSATALCCSRCSFIMYFRDKPDKTIG